MQEDYVVGAVDAAGMHTTTACSRPSQHQQLTTAVLQGSSSTCMHSARKMSPASKVSLLRAGDAVSVAVSTGGLASSASTSKGDASVHTTTIAAQGGKAVVSQGADSGLHEVTKVAVGNATTTVQHHEPGQRVTWEDAPTCPFQPTANNSRADNNQRLWGWHNNKWVALDLSIHLVSWLCIAAWLLALHVSLLHVTAGVLKPD
jgi:hypothetical protein